MDHRWNAPLAPLTTLGVGGPAHLLVEADTEQDVLGALDWAQEMGLGRTLVIGGGSNLLVADRGFEGLVLRVRVHHMIVDDAAPDLEIDVGAGVPWDDFVERAVENDWAGVECLSGIPGDVGATPIQNVGAYGQEVKDTIVAVRAVDRETRELVVLDNARCAFGYRDSAFKHADKDRFIITSVRFRLRPDGAPHLAYAELSKKLAGSANPSLAEVRAAVIELRRGKSMVLDPSDENGKSAGSFFMNPTVTAAEADRVAASISEQMPRFPAANGHVKLSAAWLIERAGFQKGTHDGPVGISTKHSLAIVNRGGATAAQIVAFARRVREGVRERFGVTLVPEPVLVGFEPHEIAGLVGH